MLLLFILILLFASLVIIHEWGHFIAARRGKVEVEEFGVGFPPYAWGRKIKGTLYSINWLPLGGFVRLKGEDGADRSPGSFGGASYWTKTKILLAGVVMNLVTAVVLFYGLAVTGLPALGSFEPGFLKSTYAQPKQLVVVDAGKGSPAEKAGIKRGDLLLEANGKKLETDKDLSSFTKANAGQTVNLKLKSQGEERSVDVTLRPEGGAAGYLGVASQQVYKLRYDPVSAIVAAFWVTGGLFLATILGVVNLIAGIPGLIIGLFSSSVPAAAEQASGPVGILFIFNSISSLGAEYIWLFLGNIAVALAAFNVLPLPALDGGRLALITWQQVTRKQISPETEAKIHGIGFMVLIGLMLVITIYDLRKFL